MANPHAPDPDLVAEAYRLTRPPPVGEDMSLAQVALRLGISKTTASSYVQKAIAHVPLVELLKRARMQGDMAHRITSVLFEVYELASERRPKDADDDPTEWLAILDFAAKREAQLAVLLGLNSPTKLDVRTSGSDGEREHADKSLLEALERIDERDARDDAAIRAGRPGVIEGSASD